MKALSAIAVGILFAFLGLRAAQAQAPVVTNAQPGELYVAVGGVQAPATSPLFSIFCSLNTFCIYPAGINVKDIATTGQLNDFAMAGAARVNALSSGVTIAQEAAAIAGAMKDAIPNAGDRFAIRFNAAGYESAAAGAIGVSWNVNDTARLHLNYGQGRSQAMVSGGLNLSFR